MLRWLLRLKRRTAFTRSTWSMRFSSLYSNDFETIEYLALRNNQALQRLRNDTASAAGFAPSLVAPISGSSMSSGAGASIPEMNSPTVGQGLTPFELSSPSDQVLDEGSTDGGLERDANS
mmetsp:Transcript_20728/g.51087  ORF Transcript_20728/g.51087 Transcript_20728/m.51087 type:complete len:120 (+) Transcript_20728:175-534(+)